MKKVNFPVICLIATSLIFGCENEEINPKVLKGNIEFHISSLANIHDIDLDENFTGNQMNNSRFNVYHSEGEDVSYVNLQIPYRSKTSSDVIYLNFNYEIPDEYFDEAKGNEKSSIKNMEDLEMLLLNDKYFSGYNFSYVLNEEDISHYYQSKPIENEENLISQISRSEIKNDEFGNTWLYLNGTFETDMVKTSFYGFNTEEFNIDFKLNNGIFSALFLLEGQIIIETN